MMSADLTEGAATFCNILANATVLRAMCVNSDAPVPKLALGLQISANILWIAFATSRRDMYLASTACTSLAMQSVSLYMRSRKKKEVKRSLIKPDRSLDGTLPQI